MESRAASNLRPIRSLFARAGSLIIGACALIVSSPGAQPASKHPVPVLSGRYLPGPEAHPESLFLSVDVELAPGWHINSDQPKDEFLVPARLEAQGKGWAFGVPKYPAPVLEHSEVIGGEVSLFTGRFGIRVPAVKLLGKGETWGKRRAGRGTSVEYPPDTTHVTLHYQACTATQCLPPRSVSLALPGGRPRTP